MNEKIANAADVAFTVRSYEAGIAGHVTLPSLCNYMQEAAGVNAARLGWGIQDLQAEGLTWMLSRLHVSVTHYVPWGETITNYQYQNEEMYNNIVSRIAMLKK